MPHGGGGQSYSAKAFDLLSVPLFPKYPEERVLKTAKVKDLLKLANFLAPTSKAWLLELVER